MAATFLVFALSSATLLLPAFYNRFPLLFPDTQVYLKVAFSTFWTLDRSGFYGLMFKPIMLSADALTGLWLAVAVQAATIAAVLVLIVRRFLPQASPVAAFGIIFATAALTSLPWHAAQLMPDAYTGALVLLAWYVASRNVGAPGSPLLWLAAAVLALVHFTHLGLLAVVVAVALTFAAGSGAPLREIGKRAVAGLLTIAAVVSAHVATNGILFNRWAVSPMGSWFLFARLHEDGLAVRWLDRHCGRDAPQPLCDIRTTLPRDSQALLWWKGSPLYPHIHGDIGSTEFWRWVERMDQAAKGSIREEPLAFITAAVRGGANQFVTFQAVDDQCPVDCQSRSLLRMQPELASGMHASRQLRDELPKPAIRAVTNTVAVIGLLLLVPLFLIARRRKDSEAQSLLAVIAACLVANALMAGALSDVHDRYQSRVVWLAPFAALLLAARWGWLIRRSVARQ